MVEVTDQVRGHACINDGLDALIVLWSVLREGGGFKVERWKPGMDMRRREMHKSINTQVDYHVRTPSEM